MRKLLIVLAVLFATSLWTTAGVEAAMKCPTKHHVRHHMKTMKKCTCHRVKRHHKARAAKVARGPAFNPVINVPQQPAPVVNVPQQAAPVVNIPAEQPTVGITVDTNSIYIVRGNQLTVLDKCSYECKKTVMLP